jgi:hypothetical protein
MKDKTVQMGKVLEVDVDKIKYKKTELPNGPTYEILKKDVLKIQYWNGYTEIYDSLLATVEKTKKAVNDTCDYSKIFVVFDAFGDYSFPLYFNGKYIWTLKPSSRLEYKFFSEGFLLVERMPNKNKRQKQPSVSLDIIHGQFYGIRITIPYPQSVDPTKKFKVELISDSTDFAQFLKNEYYGFTPFKVKEFIGVEDRKKPTVTH